MKPPFEDVELFPVVQSTDGAVEHEERHEESAGKRRRGRVRELGCGVERRPDVCEDDAESERAARRGRNERQQPGAALRLSNA